VGKMKQWLIRGNCVLACACKNAKSCYDESKIALRVISFQSFKTHSRLPHVLGEYIHAAHQVTAYCRGSHEVAQVGASSTVFLSSRGRA